MTEKSIREQQEELFEAAKQMLPCFEHLPQYDLSIADCPHNVNNKCEVLLQNGIQPGKITAGFLHTFGTDDFEKPQKLFCYIGIPEHASREKKVSAMLLIHGGAGQAYSQWIEEWVHRGYAAITIDLYGNMPLENGAYLYNFMEPEEKHAYRSTPTGMCNDGFDLAHPRDRITSQGMFHVIAANILAGNLLRSLPFVDEERIGVTGISWGGVSTAILIGFDQRFSFAVPVYGSAFLDQSRTYFYDWYQDADCARLWEVGNRLQNFRQPILWLNDANDDAFSANSTSLSFIHSVDAVICLKYDLIHTHKFDIKEVYAFAEQVWNEGTPLPVFKQIAVPEMGRKFTLKTNLQDFEGACARLYYITQPMSYHREENITKMDQSYLYAPGAAVLENDTVRVEVPSEACAYFIELWRGDVMTSTPLVEFTTSHFSET